MNRRDGVLRVGNTAIGPVVLAITGFAAILVGMHQGVLHVAPGYQGTINAGGEIPGRREWLLAGLGVLGIIGAGLSIRRKHGAVVPVAVGGAVVFVGVRTMMLAARGLPYPLYTETTNRLSGEPIMFIFGAEPFLLLAGGGLLIGAGLLGWRERRDQDTGDEISSPSSSAT